MRLIKGQMTLFRLGDRLISEGWTNDYDRHPSMPGTYEVLCVRDYAFMKRQKMEYKGGGRWYVGSSGIEPNYWREINDSRRTNQRKQ